MVRVILKEVITLRSKDATYQDQEKSISALVSTKGRCYLFGSEIHLRITVSVGITDKMLFSSIYGSPEP